MDTLTGKDAFRLIDTHGLPLEIVMSKSVFDVAEFVEAALKVWKPSKLDRVVREASSLLPGDPANRERFLTMFRACVMQALRRAA